MDTNDLPPFARELLRRKKGNQNILSQSLPKPFNPQQFSPNNSGLIDNETYFNQSYENTEEIASLRNTIVELEQEIAELTSKNQSEKQLQKILEKEQENTAELARNLDKINDNIKENEDRTAAYLEQITQMQSMIDNKDEVIDLKSTMISKLNDEYQQLKKDYDSIMKQTADQIEELGNLRDQISALNREVSPLRSLKKRKIFQPNPISIPSNDNQFPDFPIDDQNNFDDYFLNQPINNQLPVPNFDDFEREIQQQSKPIYNEPPPIPSSPMPNSPNQTPPRVHAALVDNISFDYDSGKKVNYDVEIEPHLNKHDLEKQLMELQIRKKDIENIFNRSPSRNMTLAESKRQRMQNENEFNELEQKISKIQLLLKQMQ